MIPVFGFVLALFFTILGLMGMILPWSEAVRSEVVTFILNNNLLLSLFGFFFFIMGVGLFFQIAYGFKRKYTTISQGESKVDISEEVFHDYLSIYFNELFPYTEIPCQISLKKRKARVTADLPYVPQDEQKAMLKKIETDLSDIFRELIGYRQALLLSISFAPTEKLR